MSTNLTLDPDIKRAAKAFAYGKNEDLSKVVEDLLVAEIKYRRPAADPARAMKLAVEASKSRLK